MGQKVSSAGCAGSRGKTFRNQFWETARLDLSLPLSSNL